MEQRPSVLHTLKRLYALGLGHGWAFSGMIVGMVALGLLSAAAVWVVQPILEVFGPMVGGEVPDLQPDELATLEARMSWLGSVLIALCVPAALVAGGTWQISQWLANRCLRDLRQLFLDRFLDLEMAFHSSHSKGEVIARMSQDMEATLTLQRQLYGKLQQRPVEVLGMAVVLFWIDWRIAAVLTLVVAPVLAILLRLFKRTKKRAQRARQAMSNTLSSFEQVAAGIRVIKSIGDRDRALASFEAVNDQHFKNEMRTVRARSQADAVTYLLVFLLPGVMMFVALPLMRSGSIDGAVIGPFLVALGRAAALLRTTQRAWGDVLQNLPAAERIFEVIERPPSVVDAPDAVPCPEPREAIRFENVHFRYADDAEEVLKGIDLEVSIGTTVALVGESGAGKSTLLDLLPRFHDVTGGTISIDGTDIRRFTLKSLVAQFAIVQQDSFLFNDSVYANIALGRPAATREQIEEAAERAHVHHAILALEGGQGYQTLVGDRGERLSGGQRQRVAIARALLRDSPVLLLDEPTSALDADSERHVQDALQELMRGRTCIVVAHRLATVQHADRICVLSAETGTVVEQGNHQELLRLDGEYARLVRMQQLDAADETPSATTTPG